MIVEVAYSLAPEVGILAMVGDVKSVIVWTKQHSEELEIHDDRVGGLLGRKGVDI